MVWNVPILVKDNWAPLVLCFGCHISVLLSKWGKWPKNHQKQARRWVTWFLWSSTKILAGIHRCKVAFRDFLQKIISLEKSKGHYCLSRSTLVYAKSQAILQWFGLDALTLKTILRITRGLCLSSLQRDFCLLYPQENARVTARDLRLVLYRSVPSVVFETFTITLPCLPPQFVMLNKYHLCLADDLHLQTRPSAATYLSTTIAKTLKHQL